MRKFPRGLRANSTIAVQSSQAATNDGTPRFHRRETQKKEGELDRKIRDRKMTREIPLPIFLSLIFLSKIHPFPKPLSGGLNVRTKWRVCVSFLKISSQLASRLVDSSAKKETKQSSLFALFAVQLVKTAQFEQDFLCKRSRRPDLFMRSAATFAPLRSFARTSASSALKTQRRKCRMRRF